MCVFLFFFFFSLLVCLLAGLFVFYFFVCPLYSIFLFVSLTAYSLQYSTFICPCNLFLSVSVRISCTESYQSVRRILSGIFSMAIFPLKVSANFTQVKDILGGGKGHSFHQGTVGEGGCNSRISLGQLVGCTVG